MKFITYAIVCLFYSFLANRFQSVSMETPLETGCFHRFHSLGDGNMETLPDFGRKSPRTLQKGRFQAFPLLQHRFHDGNAWKHGKYRPMETVLEARNKNTHSK